MRTQSFRQIRPLLAGVLFFVSSASLSSVQAQGLQPEPLPIALTPAAVINGWIATGDEAAMRAHAWALWSAANTQSKSGNWPIWETWYTDTEVLAGPPTPLLTTMLFKQRLAGRPQHSFELPRQLRHLQAMQRKFGALLAAKINTDEQVVGFNKFNADYAQFVWGNTFQTPAALWKIQDAWPGGTAVADRHIPPFRDAAIGLKPVFEVVRGSKHNNGITLLNYWLGDLTTGPTHSTNPAHPTSSTWNQCVVVNTGAAAIPSGLKCQHGQNPSGTVTQNDFYNFELTAGEAQAICNAQGISPCTVQEGDYAVLVAMHFTTREIDNWTWQTFWWNYGQPFPYGPPPASVPAPYNHYAMCTAYSMTTNPPNNAKGKNTLCYNPYLEPSSGIPDGIHSNCMSCHGVASYGSNPNGGSYPSSYSPTAYISVSVPADSKEYYACQTTTDFSWFLANAAGSDPGPGPACNP